MKYIWKPQGNHNLEVLYFWDTWESKQAVWWGPAAFPVDVRKMEYLPNQLSDNQGIGNQYGLVPAWTLMEENMNLAPQIMHRLPRRQPTRSESYLWWYNKITLTNLGMSLKKKKQIKITESTMQFLKETSAS